MATTIRLALSGAASWKSEITNELYAIFTPSCQCRAMDLGFSRRDRSRDARGADADRLRSLLAEIAMRQSMTATARLQAGGDVTLPVKNAVGAIGHFAPTVTSTIPASAFHPLVAAAFVNERQDS